MKPIIAIITTTIVLSTATVDAHADDRGLQGFFKVLGAVAQAAATNQGYRSHPDAQYDDYGYDQVADYGPEIFDLRGTWVMRNGNRNHFQQTHQGYYVAPVGRGRGVHYVEIGDNLYQDANSSGTYEVLDWDYMVWRSNDRRNLVIELFRQ